MKIELKPCPFCGGEPHIMHCGAGTYMIQCLQCKATTDDGGLSRISDNWNRRAALAEHVTPPTSEPNNAPWAEIGERKDAQDTGRVPYTMGAETHTREGREDDSSVREPSHSDGSGREKAPVASALAEQQGVEVKKLEWKPDWGGTFDDIPEWRADTPWGSLTASLSGHRTPSGARYECHHEVPTDLKEKLIADATAFYEAKVRSALVDVPAVESEPVAWMDDGTCRAGSGHTAYRVVTDEQKRGMLGSIAASFTVPLYAHPPRSLSNEPVAKDDALLKAALAVEQWWFERGNFRFDGAPSAILALRAALSTRKGSAGDGAATGTTGGVE